jgi:hypothetical protein
VAGGAGGGCSMLDGSFGEDRSEGPGQAANNAAASSIPKPQISEELCRSMS